MNSKNLTENFIINNKTYIIDIIYAKQKSDVLKNQKNDNPITIIGLNGKEVGDYYINLIISYLNSPINDFKQLISNPEEIYLYYLKKLFQLFYISYSLKINELNRYLISLLEKNIIIMKNYKSMLLKLIDDCIITDFTDFGNRLFKFKNVIITPINSNMDFNNYNSNMDSNSNSNSKSYNVLYDIFDYGDSIPRNYKKKDYKDLIEELFNKLYDIHEHLNKVNLKFKDIFNQTYKRSVIYFNDKERLIIPSFINYSTLLPEDATQITMSYNDDFKSIILNDFNKTSISIYLKKIYNIRNKRYKSNLYEYKYDNMGDFGEYYRIGFIDSMNEFLNNFKTYIENSIMYFTKAAILDLNDFTFFIQNSILSDDLNRILISLIDNKSLLIDNKLVNNNTAYLEDLCLQLGFEKEFNKKIYILCDKMEDFIVENYNSKQNSDGNSSDDNSSDDNSSNVNSKKSDDNSSDDNSSDVNSKKSDDNSSDVNSKKSE